MSINGSVSQRPESKVALNLLRLPHPRTGWWLTQRSSLKCAYRGPLPGFPCLFLPLEKLPSTLNQSNTLLEIQAICPPEERSWIVGEECIAGESNPPALTFPTELNVQRRWKVVNDDTNGSSVPSHPHPAGDTAGMHCKQLVFHLLNFVTKGQWIHISIQNSR